MLHLMRKKSEKIELKQQTRIDQQSPSLSHESDQTNIEHKTQEFNQLNTHHETGNPAFEFRHQSQQSRFLQSNHSQPLSTTYENTVHNEHQPSEQAHCSRKLHPFNASIPTGLQQLQQYRRKFSEKQSPAHPGSTSNSLSQNENSQDAQHTAQTPPKSQKSTPNQVDDSMKNQVSGPQTPSTAQSVQTVLASSSPRVSQTNTADGAASTTNKDPKENEVEPIQEEQIELQQNRSSASTNKDKQEENPESDMKDTFLEQPAEEVEPSSILIELESDQKGESINFSTTPTTNDPSNLSEETKKLTANEIGVMSKLLSIQADGIKMQQQYLIMKNFRNGGPYSSYHIQKSPMYMNHSLQGMHPHKKLKPSQNGPSAAESTNNPTTTTPASKGSGNFDVVVPTGPPENIQAIVRQNISNLMNMLPTQEEIIIDDDDQQPTTATTTPVETAAAATAVSTTIATADDNVNENEDQHEQSKDESEKQTHQKKQQQHPQHYQSGSYRPHFQQRHHQQRGYVQDYYPRSRTPHYPSVSPIRGGNNSSITPNNKTFNARNGPSQYQPYHSGQSKQFNNPNQASMQAREGDSYPSHNHSHNNSNATPNGKFYNNSNSNGENVNENYIQSNNDTNSNEHPQTNGNNSYQSNHQNGKATPIGTFSRMQGQHGHPYQQQSSNNSNGFNAGGKATPIGMNGSRISQNNVQTQNNRTPMGGNGMRMNQNNVQVQYSQQQHQQEMQEQPQRYQQQQPQQQQEQQQLILQQQQNQSMALLEIENEIQTRIETIKNEIGPLLACLNSDFLNSTVLGQISSLASNPNLKLNTAGTPSNQQPVENPNNNRNSNNTNSNFNSNNNSMINNNFNNGSDGSENNCNENNNFLNRRIYQDVRDRRMQSYFEEQSQQPQQQQNILQQQQQYSHNQSHTPQYARGATPNRTFQSNNMTGGNQQNNYHGNNNGNYHSNASGRFNNYNSNKNYYDHNNGNPQYSNRDNNASQNSNNSTSGGLNNSLPLRNNNNVTPIRDINSNSQGTQGGALYGQQNVISQNNNNNNNNMINNINSINTNNTMIDNNNNNNNNNNFSKITNNSTSGEESGNEKMGEKLTFRSGEWLCVSCRSLNFPNREACFRCGRHLQEQQQLLNPVPSQELNQQKQQAIKTPIRSVAEEGAGKRSQQDPHPAFLNKENNRTFSNVSHNQNAQNIMTGGYSNFNFTKRQGMNLKGRATPISQAPNAESSHAFNNPNTSSESNAKPNSDNNNSNNSTNNNSNTNSNSNSSNTMSNSYNSNGNFNLKTGRPAFGGSGTDQNQIKPRRPYLSYKQLEEMGFDNKPLVGTIKSNATTPGATNTLNSTSSLQQDPVKNQIIFIDNSSARPNSDQNPVIITSIPITPGNASFSSRSSMSQFNRNTGNSMLSKSVAAASALAIKREFTNKVQSESTTTTGFNLAEVNAPNRKRMFDPRGLMR